MRGGNLGEIAAMLGYTSEIGENQPAKLASVTIHPWYEHLSVASSLLLMVWCQWICLNTSSAEGPSQFCLFFWF
jgi:hypothetical protein